MEISLWLRRLRDKLHDVRLREILFIGIVARLVLIPLASESFDVSVWYYLANDMLKGLGIYSSHTFAYPPLWAYTFLPLIRLLALLVSPLSFGQSSDNLTSAGILPGSLQPIVSPSFLTAMKLPLLAADMFSALLIYRIVSEFSGRERAVGSMGLWILSPSIIWTSFGHGQFDVLPAVLTLTSSYLLYKKHPLSAGTALSLAILYKLYPILFIPLYLALLAVDTDGRPASHRRSKNFLKFLSGLAAPAAFFLIAPPSSGFFDSLSSRAGLIFYFGGFGPLSLLNLPQFMFARQVFILNSQLATWSLLAIQIALSVLVALKMTHRERRDSFSANILGHIFILIIILLTYPLTNPQYIVWILPFLILLYGVTGQYLKRCIILSILGFLFTLMLMGPGYFFYSTALHYGFPSIASLHSLDQVFSPFILPATAICQSVGFATLLSFLKPNLSIFRSGVRVLHAERGLKEHPKQLRLGPRVAWRMEGALRLILVFLVVSAAFMTLNPLSTSSPSLTINNYEVTQSSTTTYEATIQLAAGTYTAQINSLLMPLRTNIHQPPIYIYYAPAYPTSLTDLRGWTGILDHLPLELQTRRYPSTVSRVDADELAQVIDSSVEAAVIIPSGVLPSTTNITRLRSFLQNGGTLFWIGDRIGYYSSRPALILDRASPENPRYAAQEQLFAGVRVSENYTSLDIAPGQIYPPYDAGDSPTNLSRALNLHYPATLVGASLSAIAALGGTAIGTVNTKTNQTSIAVVPVGMGRVVLFGGGVTFQFASSGEMTIAADIAQIMSGGFLDSTFEFALQQRVLLPNQTVITTLTLILNTSEVLVGVLLVAYSPDPHVAFFSQKVLHPP